MNVFFSHMNFMPLLYGGVLFLSAFLMVRNITHGRVFQAAAVAAVLYLGFQMHGEHVESRMGVAIAALLLDLSWGLMFRRS